MTFYAAGRSERDRRVDGTTRTGSRQSRAASGGTASAWRHLELKEDGGASPVRRTDGQTVAASV